MDLFEHRYYRLSKTLMTLLGQWPSQSMAVRRGLPVVFIVLFIFQIASEFLAVLKNRNNRKIVLEGIISFLFAAVAATKLLSFVWNSQTNFMLLNRIRTDWKVWSRDREVNILHKYAAQGEKIITMYTAAVYTTLLVFLSQPIGPKIIDVLLKNGTEPGKFPVAVYYYHLDTQKYYFHIIMYTSVCASIGVTVIVASDVMLISYVQHVCGFFTALGHQLERIGTNDPSVKKGEKSYTLDKKHMLNLASCIDKHNDAIEYADLIQATYKWSFLFIVGIGMIMANAISLEILLNPNDLEGTLRFIAYLLTTIFHFYIECYLSQILIDHSIGIHFYIQNSQWYRLPHKAQKLIQLMAMRCGVPCQLTAGNLFNMSVRTFGQTARTGMSYFTLLRTMQI